MSDKVKVNIQMEDAWQFWPVNEYGRSQGPLTMEIDAELFDRFTKAREAYDEVNQLMEQLYRVQEGLKPWQSVGVPEHTLLVKPGEPV
jgi:transcriptional regulator of NAD metabolism